MFVKAAKVLKENRENLSKFVTDWVKKNYPTRTKDFHKCTRDLTHIIDSLVYCLEEDSLDPMKYVARTFFNRGELQLKSLHVEFDAYNKIVEKVSEVFEETEVEDGSIQLCKNAMDLFKRHLNDGCVTNNDNLVKYIDHETRIKHILYGWDDEVNIMRNMQQCQRNWDTSKKIPQEGIDYLLWIAENAPSKQHEAYYDIYYSTDRETIEYLYKFSWGSTNRREPPSCWRNSQMNANLYMIFVCKQPPTMYNCNNDGSDQDHFGESRWENAVMSAGMAMGLVMRAANKMGLRTGPNKIKDLGPDYDYEWEKKLGILDDIRTGKKRLFYGLGIGIPNINMPRWQSEDTELALGASNGSHISTRYNEPDWEPYTAPKKDRSRGHEKRKVKIIDIRDYAGQEVEDPYGNTHTIPETHEIKINTPRKRDILVQEIPKE